MKPANTQQPQATFISEQRLIEQPQVAKGLSAEQRKALELLEEKCPFAQRDDGYDTVY